MTANSGRCGVLGLFECSFELCANLGEVVR